MLDTHLWTYRDDSFLPHGTDATEFSADQPILLTAGGDNGNNATVPLHHRRRDAAAGW